MPLGSMMKRALKQMLSSILYTLYFLATSPTGPEANLTHMKVSPASIMGAAWYLIWLGMCSVEMASREQLREENFSKRGSRK